MMNTKQDLTGQVFGHLTVLGSSVEKTKSASSIWLCKCDCGKEIEVVSTNLVNPYITSCGCIPSPKKIKKGFVYGLWTVMEETEGKGYILSDKYLCSCACGNQKKVFGNNLIAGMTTSCGCIQLTTRSLRTGIVSPRKDLIGQLNGSYEVVEGLELELNTPREYRCVCPNGHERIFDSITINRKSSNPVCWCLEENLIRRYRKKLEYSMVDLAEAADASKQAISLVEMKHSIGSKQFVYLLADLLDIPEKEVAEFISNRRRH